MRSTLRTAAFSPGASESTKANDVSITETQDDRYYYLGTDGEYYCLKDGKYYKVSPIKWRILSENKSEGTALILAESVLDSRAYDGNYVSSYNKSQIHAWLNTTFFKTAFTAEERKSIEETTVDNSAYSTGVNDNPYANNVTTYDHIFLLSRKEATNASYGFTSDASRKKKPTAYAEARGIYVEDGYSYWWLRSPSSDYNSFVQRVFCDGTFNQMDTTFAHGIVPALTLNLKKLQSEE